MERNQRKIQRKGELTWLAHRFVTYLITCLCNGTSFLAIHALAKIKQGIPTGMPIFLHITVDRVFNSGNHRPKLACVLQTQFSSKRFYMKNNIKFHKMHSVALYVNEVWQQ